jgi:hypothetical protein
MEDIVTQRVNEFRQDKQMSILALSKVLEMNQTTLNKQLKDDGCGVQVSTLVKILSVYPELSAEWLLRGEGEMKKGDEWKVTQFIPIQNNDLVDALKDHIATLKADNDRMRQEIDEYKREKIAAPIEYSSMAADGN